MEIELDEMFTRGRQVDAVTKRFSAVIQSRGRTPEASERLALQVLYAIMSEANLNGVKPLEACERFVTALEKP